MEPLKQGYKHSTFLSSSKDTGWLDRLGAAKLVPSRKRRLNCLVVNKQIKLAELFFSADVSGLINLITVHIKCDDVCRAWSFSAKTTEQMCSLFSIISNKGGLH